VLLQLQNVPHTYVLCYVFSIFIYFQRNKYICNICKDALKLQFYWYSEWKCVHFYFFISHFMNWLNAFSVTVELLLLLLQHIAIRYGSQPVFVYLCVYLFGQRSWWSVGSTVLQTGLRLRSIWKIRIWMWNISTRGGVELSKRDRLEWYRPIIRKNRC